MRERDGNTPEKVVKKRGLAGRITPGSQRPRRAPAEGSPPPAPPPWLRKAAGRFAGLAGGWSIPALLAALLLTLCVADGVRYNRSRETVAHVLASAEAAAGPDFLETGRIELRGVAGLSERYLREHLSLQGGRAYTLDKESTAADAASLTFGGAQNRPYEVRLRLPEANRTLRWTVNRPTMTAAPLKSSIVRGESIYLRFSEPVDEHSLREGLWMRSREQDTGWLRMRVDGAVVEISVEHLGESDWYQLYLSEEVMGVSGNRLAEPCTFEITVRPERSIVKRAYSVSLAGPSTVIRKPGQPLLMELSGNTRYWPTGQADVTLYRFDGLDDYIGTASAYELEDKTARAAADPAARLEKVDARRIPLEDVASAAFENPGPGAYLMEAVYTNPLTGETERLRKTVMVSDISLYAQSVGGQTLVWLNSAATGGPLAGHTVDFLDPKGAVAASAVTDGDGVAVAEGDYDPYADRPGSHRLRVRDAAGNSVYADRTSVLSWNYRGEYDRYYSYFYLDRAIYRPTDELRFWGFVRAHESNGSPAPRQVRVVFDPGGLDISIDAAVDENNVFHGALPIEKVKSAHYSVVVYVGYEGPEVRRGENGETVREQVEKEIVLDADYVQVKEYQKPLFVISARNDKLFYNYGEEVSIEVTPRFYDGTPLPNYALEYIVYDSYYGEERITGSVLTNSDGVATITFPASTIQSYLGWRPATGLYRILIKSDGEDISHAGTYTYFPTDTALVGNTALNRDGTATLRAITRRLNLSPLKTADDLQAIDQANYYYYEDTVQYYDEAYEPILGEPLSRTVAAVLRLDYYDYTGGYRTAEKSINFPTKDGEGRMDIDLEEWFGVRINTGRYRWLDVTYRVSDSLGQRVEYRHSGYSPGRGSSGGYSHAFGDPYDGPPIYRDYAFAVTNDAGESALGDFAPHLPYDYVLFNEGENFHLSLLYNGRPAENRGRMLYTVIQDKIIRRGFTGESTLHFTESVRYANNINIAAAYFDGVDVHPVRNVVAAIASDSLRLTVEALSDKAEYRPGETASISLKVTDANGAGVRGNAVISVVDESVFALREQYIELLQDLYREANYYNYYVRKYTSLLRDVPSAGMGAGGKGSEEVLSFDDSYRKNFRDTAAFFPVRTDAAGNATVTFTVPDNLTSWRVTALGVGDNLFAGQTQSSFKTALPFFISPVVSTKYIEGDDVALQVRGYGAALPPGGQVDFTVTLTGDNYRETVTARSAAYQASHVNFGRLPVGEYTLIATAVHGQSRDTVELPVTVIPSNLELVVSRPVNLAAPLDIDALRYPVTLSFYSAEHEPYFQTLGSLLRHYCNIANQRMSRFVAKRELAAFMEPSELPRYLSDGTDSVSDMQNSDGGAAWYEGEKSDVALTAKVALVAADQFNQNTMKEYFRRAIDTYGGDLVPAADRRKSADAQPDRRKVCHAYLGLAALGEPVAEQVRPLLALPGSSGEDRAILIAALACEGGGNPAVRAEAEAAYREHITPFMDSRTAGASFVRPDSNDWERMREDDRITAAAWIAASRLGHGDADRIAAYFGAWRWRIDTLFEAMVYVSSYDRQVRPVSFEYEVNGETRTLDLGLEGRKTLRLDRSALESFRMGAVPSDLAATAYYIGMPAEADLVPSENIGIEKEIRPVGENRYEVTLKITFGESAETGQYDISDWVPSNMRVYKLTGRFGAEDKSWRYRSSTEGQKLYFTLWRDSGAVRTATIRYTVQQVFEAGAMVDSAYIIHGNSGDSNLTPRYSWLN